MGGGGTIRTTYAFVEQNPRILGHVAGHKGAALRAPAVALDAEVEQQIRRGAGQMQAPLKDFRMRIVRPDLKVDGAQRLQHSGAGVQHRLLVPVCHVEPYVQIGIGVRTA